MKYECMLLDLYDLLDEVNLGDIDPEYSKAVEQEGIAYYVEQFVYWCPQLDLSFREGFASDSENEDQFEIIAIYNGFDSDITNVQDIYSNCTLSSIISMIAEQRGISSSDLKCILVTPD